MKLIIDKNILVNNLENVSKALSTRNIIPVLNGIKFEVKKKGIYLTASDNDISIEILIDKKEIKKIEEEGCVIISGGIKLLELFKKLPNCDILIESYEENMINFKTSFFEYKSNCFPIEDFPNISFKESENKISIDAQKLKEMITKTSFACSLQESRPLLTGINIKLTGNIFECVATDSYRLSKIQSVVNNKENDNFNIVIPARNINEFNKIINDDGNIIMNIFENKILFVFGNIKFQSSLISGGSYPNTDNSIPKKFSNKYKINYKQFLDIIDRASLVTQSKDKNIIDMEIENDKLIIKASSIDIGKIEEKIEIINETKTNIKISYSSKFMIDALKVLDDEYIYIMINGEISPIILKEEKNDELIQLISPMKTF